MENNDLSCEVVYTDDLYFIVNKHIINKKRKGLLISFILTTTLTVILLLLDIFGSDNIHTLYAGFFFLVFSMILFIGLLQTRSSYIKKQIIKNKEIRSIKAFYIFNEEILNIETETPYSKSNTQYLYNAIVEIEKVEENIIIIDFKDKRTAIIQSNKSEDIYNYVNLKINSKEDK